jgi:hypothetical protein
MSLGISWKTGWDWNWDTLAAVSADDVNPLGNNVDTIKENTETLIANSEEVSLEVNAEKYTYIAVSSLECRTKSWHKDSYQVPLKCGALKIFGNDGNK